MAAAAFAALVILLSSRPAEAARGIVNLAVGGKIVSGMPDYLDKHTAAALEMSLAGESWPLYVALDLVRSKDTDQHAGYDDIAGIDERRGRAESDELCLGARIVLRDGSRGEPGRKVRPYFGGGASLVRGSYDSVSLQNGYLQGSTSKNGSGYGYWAQAGIMFRPRTHFSLGFDLRHSKADADMGGRHSLDLGGTQLGFFMGGAW